MNIAENIEELQASIDKNVELIAVSKTKSVSDILEAYDAGQRVFGENRVAEMAEKHTQLPDDIAWHAIGHLQRNKVKLISQFVSLIHSVDSIRLLNTIESEGTKHNRIIDCLLQIHIAEEESKSGFTPEELSELMRGETLATLSHVNIKGLMGMATNSDDNEKIRSEFKSLKTLFNNYPSFEVLSMGMSGDYEIAIEEGSNMVRVGSLIFGERN